MASLHTISTARLRAERIRPDHVDAMRLLHADERVMATLGPPLSDAATVGMVERFVAHWDKHGFGYCMLFDLADDAFVGRAGLRRVQVGGGEEVELGYAVRSEYWGRGLATEVSRALVDIGFTQLGLDSIVAFTLPHNRASRRVMEKCGFRYERDVTHANLPHVFYRLRRDDRPAGTPS